MSFGFDIVQLSTPTVFVTISIGNMIICNYFAQEITDYNNDIFITV